jgi:hypothetical protein
MGGQFSTLPLGFKEWEKVTFIGRQIKNPPAARRNSHEGQVLLHSYIVLQSTQKCVAIARLQINAPIAENTFNYARLLTQN